MKEELLKAKAGDREAQARLLQEAYPIVYGYLQKLTLNRQLAEEPDPRGHDPGPGTPQPVSGECKFSTWLVKIATNLYRDELRRQKRRERLGFAPKRQPDPTLGAWVFAALKELSPNLRAPVLLKYYCDLTYEEMADLLRIASGHSEIQTALRPQAPFGDYWKEKRKMDDFKLDKRLERLLREGESADAAFCLLSGNSGQKEGRESSWRASSLPWRPACFCPVLLCSRLGYGKAVQAFFGLVWLGLPLLLVPGREMWKNAAD